MDRDAMQYSLDDPRAYPRIYRLRRGMKAFYIFVGVFGLFLAIIIIGLAKMSSPPNESVRYNLFVVAIILAVFGVLTIIEALRYRFILHFDRVELYTLFCPHRTVLRDNLAYIDWINFDREQSRDSRDKKTLKIAVLRPALIRKDKRSSPLFFQDQIKTDEFFDRWFLALRNRASDIDRD